MQIEQLRYIIKKIKDDELNSENHCMLELSNGSICKVNIKEYDVRIQLLIVTQGEYIMYVPAEDITAIRWE